MQQHTISNQVYSTYLGFSDTSYVQVVETPFNYIFFSVGEAEVCESQRYHLAASLGVS